MSYGDNIKPDRLGRITVFSDIVETMYNIKPKYNIKPEKFDVVNFLYGVMSEAPRYNNIYDQEIGLIQYDSSKDDIPPVQVSNNDSLIMNSKSMMIDKPYKIKWLDQEFYVVLTKDDEIDFYELPPEK